MRLIDADKYCDFLNTYPLEKAQNNFMSFYRDALQYTFECEVEAIPIEQIRNKLKCCDNINAEIFVKALIRDWEEENGRI